MPYNARGSGNPVNRRGPFLIVGACGFLGSEIYLQLVSKLADKRQRGTPRILALVRSVAAEDINPRLMQFHDRCPVEFLQSAGDVVTLRELEGWRQDRCNGYIAGIFHVAGMAVPSNDAVDVEQMQRSNVDLSSAVFTFAAKYNIRCVYSSCSGVVGCQFLEDGRTLAAHDDSKLCEASIAPFPFLVQKAHIEERWQQEALKGRAPIVFLRPSTLFGPGDERLSSTMVLYDAMRGAFKTRSPGGISFVDVRDCARAFVAVLLNDGIEGGTAMNLTACNMPFDDFAALVEVTLRVKGPRFGLPPAVELAVARMKSRVRRMLRMPANYASTPCAVMLRQRFWNVTCQRAKELVDWDPMELEETILDTSRFIYTTFMAVDPRADRDDLLQRRHCAMAASARDGRRGHWRLPGEAAQGRRLDGYVMVLVGLVVMLLLLVARDHFAVTGGT